MSTNDKQTNTNYKNQKNKMPHMFQKSNQGPKLDTDDIDLLPQHQQNLSKIVKSYRSPQDIHLGVKRDTLVSTAKNLLETQTNEGIDSLYDYLEQLKTKYSLEKVPDVDENKKIEAENNETTIKIEESSDQININDILQKSEQEIINSTDQKSLLKSLIDDINLNSSSRTNNDDSMLEHNITEIINETVDEDIIIEEVEETTIDNDIEKPVVQKKNIYGILIIFFLIILVIMGYLYKDIFLEFFEKIL